MTIMEPRPQARSRADGQDKATWTMPEQGFGPSIEFLTLPVGTPTAPPRVEIPRRPDERVLVRDSAKSLDLSRHFPRDGIALGSLVFADLIALLVAVLVADPLQAAVIFAAAAVVWQSSGLYSRRFTMSVLDDIPALALGVVCGTALPALVAWGQSSPPLFAALTLLAGITAARSIAYAVIRQRRRMGTNGFRTVLIGGGPVAQTLTKRILAHPETGIRLVGVLDESQPEHANAFEIPYLGRAADLDHNVREHEVHDVIVCDGELSSTELIEVLRACGRLTTEMYVVPQLLQMHRLVSTTDQVWGVPLERVRRQKVSGLAWRLKRLMDIVLSSAALAVLFPVFVFVSLAVRYELGAGLIFKQERVGLDGRRFSLLKFRSMPHVTAANERPWCVHGEVEIGPVGRFIRRFSLDELPQLLNVLAGDMSLVGPRPERPQFVEQFSTDVSGYGHRHRVPVGLTGLAAVQGLRGDTSLLDRAYFDNCYIENWSLWLDMKVLVRSVVAVARGTGG